jgi:hypothetical protein
MVNLFSIDNEPRYFPQLFTDVENYLSWESAEYCIGNPQFYEVELIVNNLKPSIPKFKKKWIEKLIPEKSYLFDQINQGAAFLINNYGFYNRYTESLLRSISEKFDVFPDIHVYGGLQGSGSFSIHTDYPPNIIIQAVGRTPWRIWKDIDQSATIDIVLSPGDALYIPAGMHHVAEPNSERLSMSIPLWPRETAADTHIDRNVYKINHTE